LTTGLKAGSSLRAWPQR